MVPGSRTAGQQASRGSRLGRNRVDKESVARFLVGRVLAASRRLLVVPWYSWSAKASKPAVRFRVRVLVEGGRWWSRQCDRLGRTVGEASQVSKQQGNCRRRETKRAVDEGRGGGRGRWHSFAPVRTASRAVPCPDLRANPGWRAGVSSLGSATIASTRRRAVQIQTQTFHQPSESQGVSSSSRARPLCWLCQSPPLAVASSSGNSACPSAAIDCLESGLLFLASAPAFPAPRSIQATPPGADWGEKPESLRHRPESLLESGPGAPKAAPAPPCLLEPPPSIEAQHFSIRQSSIYVGL